MRRVCTLTNHHDELIYKKKLRSTLCLVFTIFMIVVPITSSKALQPDIPESER